jgi:hypothetical protein
MIPVAALLAGLLVLQPTQQASAHTQTVQKVAAAAEEPVNEGDVLNWASVRTGPATTYSIVTTYPPRKHVLIYEEVVGENVWGTTPIWYRVSPHDQPPLFIYGGLVAVVK